jgi:hypothetical protein
MPEAWSGIDGKVAEARLRGLRRRLSELDAAMVEQQQLRRLYPNSFSIGLSGDSLQAMQQSLRSELVEVLRFRASEQVTIALDGPSFIHHSAKFSDLGVIFTRFQRLYSSVAQAISTGPTSRGPIKADIVSGTSLRLRATHASSFGMQVVIASNFDLLGNSMASDALVQMFQLLHSASSDERLMRVSGEIGRRALVHLRHLAAQLEATDSTMKLGWKDFAGTSYDWSVDRDSASRIIQTIGNISETRSETKTYSGFLVGASLLRNRFEIVLDDTAVLEGKFVSGLSKDVQELFGKRVSATLDETEVADRATGEARTYYTLRSVTAGRVN